MNPPGGKRSYEEIVTGLLDYLENSGVLTDRNPGSVMRTLVEAFAREMVEAYSRLGLIYEMGFIDTAQGEALDQLVKLLGVDRVMGAVVKGVAVFQRDPRVSGQIVIPSGARLRLIHDGEQVTVFQTLQQEVMLEGRSEASVEIWAPIPEDAAADPPSIEAGAVQSVTMMEPIAGVASVQVSEAAVPRGHNESDVHLRDRVKGLIEANGGETAKAIEEAVLNIPEVTSLQLRDASSGGEPSLDPGELEVIVDAGEDGLLQPDLLAELEAAIHTSKGPGVLVRVRGLDRLDLALRLVVLPLTSPVTAVLRQAMTSDIEAKAKAHFEALGVGDTFIWNILLGELLQVDGVLDLDLQQSKMFKDDVWIPLANVEPSPLARVVLAPAPQGCEVELADQLPILVRLMITAAEVEPANQREAEEDITNKFMDALKVINLAGVDRTLSTTDIFSAISEVGPEGLLQGHMSLEVQYTRNQASVVLPDPTHDPLRLDDVDFLAAHPEGPIFTWKPEP